MLESFLANGTEGILSQILSCFHHLIPYIVTKNNKKTVFFPKWKKSSKKALTMPKWNSILYT